MFLANVLQDYIYKLEFDKKTQKTRLSRLIRELNDLCACIYKTNGKEVADWIVLTNNLKFDNKNVQTLKVNYVSFFCSIKILRNKVLKIKDLELSTERNMHNTDAILKILSLANRKGFMHNYHAIKRKYYSRKLTQEKKIEKHKAAADYACTVKFFYLWIIKMLYVHEANRENFQKDVCDELDIEIVSEYINSSLDCWLNF